MGVAKGAHIYEFGDHGSLILMAPIQTPTSHVSFTWDEGLTWSTMQISDTPVVVTNIIIEPKSVAQTFILYGFNVGNALDSDNE